MPLRKTILATGEIYHIFNRSIHHTPLFNNKRDFNLFMMAAKYYLQEKPPIKFSLYRQQPDKYQLNFKKFLVKVLAFCFMPNHYHFILRQQQKKGIQNYIHRLSNSYSHYFNLKNNRRGPVFEGKFKAVRVESQEQLVHLSRYIHLNPVTSYLVQHPADYQYSSYKIYLSGQDNNFVDATDVMADFTPNSYKKFVLDQKDYQRNLAMIKHLVYE